MRRASGRVLSCLVSSCLVWSRFARRWNGWADRMSKRDQTRPNKTKRGAMRPDALRADDGKSALRIELSNYLRDSGSALSMAEAAALAVRGWIAADRAAAQCRTRADAAAGVRMADRCEPARGYLWKTLFLPEGTQLRMIHDGKTYCAAVVGNEIICNGVSVSPRGMTMMIAGEGRNAWRDVMIQLEGARIWQRARLLRNRLGATGVAQPPTPGYPAFARRPLPAADVVPAVPVASAEQRACGPDGIERRQPRHRRREDIHLDYCAFD